MNEDKLAQELETYRELAKKDKKIDVASLMVSALQQQQANLLSDKEKHWAYLISLVFPPFGLIFAFRFYFSGKDDGEQAAWFCGVLTVLSILLTVLFIKVVANSSGLKLDQVQQVQPSQIQELLQ